MKHIKKVFTIIIVFAFVSISSAQEDTLSNVYDENTEITIKGEILEINKPVKGPVVMKIKTENRIYNVITAPAWYLTRNNIDFRFGENIEITGSKLITRTGDLYLIARKCKRKDYPKNCVFRDEYMRPMWRGGMHRN